MKIGIGTILNSSYEITGELGSGAMGTVYSALDLNLKREVAIKVLRLQDYEFSDENLARFEREARALGKIEHKNVIKVYRLGIWEANFPFVVMELLAGNSLHQLLKSQSSLSEVESLAITASIAEAMIEVHSHGILHRDLKPQNIFLAQDADKYIVKVLDFGICKDLNSAQEVERLTFTGLLIGSVHYMSPESSQGLPATERSDIYALGIILHELLTGKVPYDADTPIGVLYKQANEPVPKLAQNYPGIVNVVQLDKLLNKCLAKNPSDRYGSMKELHDDFVQLGENLQANPISSAFNYADPAGGRLRALFCSPLIVVVFSLVVLAAVAVSLTTAFKMGKIADTKKGASDSANSRHNSGPKTQNKVSDRAASSANQRLEENYKHLLNVYERAFGLEDLRLVEYLDDLSRLYHQQGRYTAALPLYKRSLAIREKHLKANDPMIGESLRCLAECYRDLNDDSDALPLFERTLAIREQTLTSRDPELAVSLKAVADCHEHLGNFTEAEPLYKRALAINEKESEASSLDQAGHIDALADCYYNQNKFADAQLLYRRSLAIAEKKLKANDPHIAQTLNRLGNCNYSLGKYADATLLYKHSLQIQEAVNPNDPQIAWDLYELGECYKSQKEYSAAESQFNRALAVWEKAPNSIRSDVLLSIGNFAGLLAKANRQAEAAKLEEHLNSVMKRLFTQVSPAPSRAYSITKLADYNLGMLKFAEAMSLYKQSLKILADVSPNDPQIAWDYYDIGDCYKHQKQLTEAASNFNLALAKWEASPGTIRTDVRGNIENLAQLFRKANRQAEAAKLEEHLKAFAAHTIPTSPD